MDLAAYNEKFKKTIILDATASLDYDYLKSHAVLCSDIQNLKRDINVYIPQKDANTSKSRLLRTKATKMKASDRELNYNVNIRNLALECKQIMGLESKKTLIVIFKEIIADRIYQFKQDFMRILDQLDETGDYLVIHHGQYTTGVNKFYDCKRLIVIGNLNKSSKFYQNKCLAVGREIDNDNTSIRSVSNTEINDYLISNIQQIGRTAFRKKELVDVYFLSRLGILNSILNELNKYFNVICHTFENKHYFKEPTKQELLIEKISDRYMWYKKGDLIKKREIKSICEELEMDDSILKKTAFKEKLREIGLVNNSDNNREYIKTRLL